MRSALLLAIFLTPSLWADDALPAAVAPFVDDQTLLVARLDLEKLNTDAVFKPLADAAHEQIAQHQAMAAKVIADLKAAGVKSIYATVNMADTVEKSGNPLGLLMPLAGEAEAAKAAETLKAHPAFKTFTVEARGAAVLAGAPGVLERAKARKPVARPDLAAAFTAGKDAAVTVALAPTKDLRRSTEETLPEFPKPLGGGSSDVLTRGLTSITFSLDTAPKLHIVLVAKAADAATAAKLHALLKAGVESLKQVKPESNEAKAAALAAGLLGTAKVDNDRVVVTVGDDQFVAFLKTVVQPVRDAASRQQSANNLKQLGLAMHMHLDTHGRFPGDILDKDGKPLLSWRVRLLPFLNENDLYKKFKLDEPWDSATNKPLIAKMPKTLIAPAQKSAAGTTTYLGPTGAGLFFQPGKEGPRIQDLTDGTSNTIMLVETADPLAVEWTKPGDWAPDDKDLFKGLLGHYAEGFQAAFADGSVRFIGKAADVKNLRNLLTIAGGEVVQSP